jgi:hypothetical protein
VTSYNKGLPVSWDRGGRGSGEGSGRAPLGRRVPPSRRVPLGRGLAF